MHQGNGFSPVPLAAEEPVAELVVNGFFPQAARLEPFRDDRLEPPGVHSVVFARVDDDPVRGAAAGGLAVEGTRRPGVGDDLDDGEAERFREFPVPLVVGGNGHDRPRTVRDEHVVGNPYRDARAVYRVDRVSAREDTGLLLREVGPFEVALAGGGVDIGLHFLLPVGGGDALHQGMLRGEDHVSGAEQGIGPGGVDLQRFIQAFYAEMDACSLAPPDPVALHELDGLRPVEFFQVLQKPVRVGGDPEHPLPDALARHLRVAAIALAVLHFLVRQSGLAGGTPIDGHVRLVGEPALEQLEENPLGPAEIVGRARGKFAVPVVGESERLDLGTEAFNVRHRGDRRMGARLYGVVLGREAEGVETHGMEHVVPAHAQEAAVDVRGRIALGMSDVEAGPGWIGEHVEHIPAPFPGIGRILHRAKRLVALPARLPFFLDLRERIFAHRRLPRETPLSSVTRFPPEAAPFADGAPGVHGAPVLRDGLNGEVLRFRVY